jgi:hypothetical protein
MELEKLKALPTEKLISYIQEDEYDSTLKENAFLTICFRFRLDLIKICEVICRKRGHDKDVAIHIVEQIFLRYYKSRCFKIEKVIDNDFDKYFILYLIKIARNELIRWWQNEQKKQKGLLYDGTEELITELPAVNINKLNKEERIIHETLTSLPYSHQIIFLNYSYYERDGVNLPRKLLQQLRTHLGGISQDTIRGYKKETIDKIEATKKIVQAVKE